MTEQRVLADLEGRGLAHRVIRHGPVGSLAEAAVARGVEPADVVKSMLVRRGDDDHLVVLVPGDRTISWPKLRALLGVSRLSMPDAAGALAVTGYERGTITPLGLDLPVVADERVAGREITLGAGAHGVAVAPHRRRAWCGPSASRCSSSSEVATSGWATTPSYAGCCRRG